MSTLRIAIALAGLVTFVAGPAGAAPPPRYQNCAGLQAAYKHGVALPGAHDVAARPVTTFVVNKPVYLANKHLDRDKDGVACEKR